MVFSCFPYIKVRNNAKIRYQYIQASHLTQPVVKHVTAGHLFLAPGIETLDRSLLDDATNKISRFKALWFRKRNILKQLFLFVAMANRILCEIKIFERF